MRTYLRLALGLILLLGSHQMSTALAPLPDPPVNIVRVANRILEFLGVAPVPGAGQIAARQFRPEYPAPLSSGWMIHWKSGSAAEITLQLSSSGQLLQVSDRRFDETVRARFDSKQPLSVTQQQAEASVLRLLRVANAKPGDWRVYGSKFNEPGPRETSPGWFVYMFRAENGRRCQLEEAHAYVEPFEGHVQFFRLLDYGIRLPAPARIIPPDVAQDVVIQAFKSVYREYLQADALIYPTATKDNPYYARINGVSPFCRLAYMYSINASNVPWKEGVSGGQSEFAASVDAETGEIWGMGWVTGGGGPAVPTGTQGGAVDLKRIPVSSQISLAAKLLANKELTALGRAVAAGRRPRDAKAAPRPDAAFTCQAGGQEEAFTLDRKKRLLRWEGSGGSRTVELPPKELALLDAWLKTRPAPPVSSAR